jgi:putative DNA primase/helicase
MAIDPRFYDLIRHLWRGGQFGYYWSPDIDGEKLTYWVALRDCEPPEVPKMFWDRDAYFGVHPTNIRRSEHERANSQRGDIAAVNCFYFEIDFDDEAGRLAALTTIDNLPWKPAAITHSGGGFHVYIALRDTYLPDTPDKQAHARKLQYAMVEFTGGDDGAKDLARVLRIPGTFNHKPEYAPNYPQVQFERFDLSQQYDLADIEQHLAPLVAARAARQAHSPSPQAQPVNLDDQALLDALFRSKNGDLYRRLWDGDTSPAGGDHSKADQMLCNGLAWVTGRDIPRMDSLFRQSGLMRDKWNRSDYRDRTLQNAADSAQTVYDPQHNGYDPNAVAAAQSAIGLGMPRVQQAMGQSPVPSGRSITDILLNEGANDEGNAQCVFHLYYGRFLHTDAYGYLFWNGQYWQAEYAESELTRAIVDTLKRRATLALNHDRDALLKATKPSATNVRNCLYLFKSLVDISASALDADPALLNCNNGVVDLRTGALTPHDSSQLFTYCVPVDYDPSADYVPWVEFLHNVTPGPEVVDYLQTAVGYSITGDTREECLFYIHGPTRSGKGTFTETLLTLLPKPLGVQADFSTFTTDRKGDTQNFDLAPLKPARFIVASESNKYDTLNEAKIKTATGGDWIRCAFKHRDHFEYRPQFKIWLISNHPVKGDVDDDAFWGRIRVIEFPNSFLGKEDKTLKKRMKDPDNLRGVLRWAVDGARQWYAQAHGLETPQAVIDATQARRTALDYIQQWIDECCKVAPGSWTSNDVLRRSYNDWCAGLGLMPKGPEQFGRALSQKGFMTNVKRRLPNGKTANGVAGLSVI